MLEEFKKSNLALEEFKQFNLAVDNLVKLLTGRLQMF